MADPVELEILDGVAVIVLNDPPLNLFSIEMRDALLAAVLAVHDVPGIGAMVLVSAGKHFGAGADLSEFGSAEHVLEARRIRWDRDVWGPLVDLPVPTIAALRGVVLGSALEMALLCDVRICGSDARVGLPEITLGMLPGAGGTQSLAHSVGAVAATPIVLTGEHLTAFDALRRGIVHRVVEPEYVRAAAMDVAERLAALPQRLWPSLRRALRAATDLPLTQGLEVESDAARVVEHLRRRDDVVHEPPAADDRATREALKRDL